ncbi:unnamed protein product [Symbiodinium sp. CCMP2592]|nr:unnamed protein product [Symbiodinium sp. CCMP2592]
MAKRRAADAGNGGAGGGRGRGKARAKAKTAPEAESSDETSSPLSPDSEPDPSARPMASSLPAGPPPPTPVNLPGLSSAAGSPPAKARPAGPPPPSPASTPRILPATFAGALRASAEMGVSVGNSNDRTRISDSKGAHSHDQSWIVSAKRSNHGSNTSAGDPVHCASQCLGGEASTAAMILMIFLALCSYRTQSSTRDGCDSTGTDSPRAQPLVDWTWCTYWTYALLASDRCYGSSPVWPVYHVCASQPVALQPEFLFNHGDTPWAAQHWATSQLYTGTGAQASLTVPQQSSWIAVISDSLLLKVPWPTQIPPPRILRIGLRSCILWELQMQNRLDLRFRHLWLPVAPMGPARRARRSRGGDQHSRSRSPLRPHSMFWEVPPTTTRPVRGQVLTSSEGRQEVTLEIPIDVSMLATATPSTVLAITIRLHPYDGTPSS